MQVLLYHFLHHFTFCTFIGMILALIPVYFGWKCYVSRETYSKNISVMPHCRGLPLWSPGVTQAHIVFLPYHYNTTFYCCANKAFHSKHYKAQWP